MRVPKYNKDPRQLLLGRTRDNQLILQGRKSQLPPDLLAPYEWDVELQAKLPFHQSTNDEIHLAMNPPFRILMLPEEIVELILKYAYSNLYTERCLRKQRYFFLRTGEPERYRVGLSLCMVSRFFYRIMHPFFYASQSIRIYQADSGIKISGNPHITAHCTDLTIHINGPLKDLPWSHDNFFSKYSKVRTLKQVYKRFHVGDVLAMQRHLSSHFPRLEHLFFDLENHDYPYLTLLRDDGLSFPVLYEAVGPQPRLKTLRILEMTPTPLSISIPNMVGTAPFTSLEISHCGEPLLCLRDLLRWPARLEHLKVHRVNILDDDSSTYFSQFQSLLSAHGQSLISMCVPSFSWPPPPRNPPNLSSLLRLEVVSMAQDDDPMNWNLYTPEAFCTYVLSAPRLRKLVWDFAVHREEDSGMPNYDFHAGHAKWLIELAQLARGQGCSLREIEILFDPGLGMYYNNHRDLTPWRLIDYVEGVLVDLGIVLLYKRHWLTKMKKRNEDLLAHELITTFIPPLG